ncbi:bifunctional methylenetetrahydrofolate dehydrogenase/methenyltetrahydrofolate cyclohydrolase FolD [Candidatus Woesearchaeota archaeon]|nr:bifunctional methylenetetrahydrofolate dehydrogenase/methenyltetrahydrofolate cyclohydrolase FolD [Candidatus Woesearchaeota archaeon]
MAEIIDGNRIAAELRKNIRQEVEKLSKKPGLAVILIGENPASKVYVNMKEIKCKEVGIQSFKYELDKDIPEEDVLKLIDKLNRDDTVNGILVQMPVPDQISESKVINAVLPEKDVDGFHPMNTGNLLRGDKSLVSCTPKGIIKLIESTGIEIEGKRAVIIGRSNIVGKPVSILLMQKNATITVCHSRTKNIKDICKNADILVAALGRPKFVTADMVKHGAVVIDVGINRVDDSSEKGYHLKGDVDFENVKERCSHITPVPGGVGPMTIACLLENTLIAYKMQHGGKNNDS